MSSRRGKRSGKPSTVTRRSGTGSRKPSAANKPCKDCVAEGVTTRRPAPHPGPRCATHHRRRRNATREAARAAHVERTYSITEEQRQELYEAQGGTCAGCPATGATRRLSVDHDHACCPGSTSCGECVRGLLCRTCNRFLGHVRDDPAALRRLADYLENPPAQRVLGGLVREETT